MRYGPGYGYGMWYVPPIIAKLIMINMGVFVFQLILDRTGLIDYLMLSVHYFFRGCIWQPLTYLFLHASLGHLFYNMIALFFFGRALEVEKGSDWLLKFFLGIGIAVGILILIKNLLFGQWLSMTLGASGAVFGVMTACAFYWPMRPVYIMGIYPVPMVILIGFFVLMEVISLGSMSQVSHFGHLAGVVVAFGYLHLSEHTNFIYRLKRRIQDFKSKQRRRHIRVVDTQKRPNRENNIQDNKKKMDAILEKVAQNGINSLSKEEKDFLDAMSRQI